MIAGFVFYHHDCHHFECVETEVPLRHVRRAIKLAVVNKGWCLLALGGGVLGGGLNDLGVIHRHT